MSDPVALLLTDLVDSAGLAQRLGDVEMGRLWAAHDRIARDLLKGRRGREIDKTDGFLLLFGAARDALAYALDYHRALSELNPPLQARAGLHVGALTLRETPQADVALGAKPVEADGISKPIAARVMSAARGGQTLLTRAAMDALGPVPQRAVSHGHWLVKGLPEPIELFEVGDDSAPFTPPPDAEKVYRVVRHGDIWLPAREVRHNLPAERDAFVGRRSNLQELARRFDQGARLVSVLGIGGCGKTRLATRYGWTWMGDYPGGVWFCDLAPARTLEGLFSAVAQGLEVPLGQDDPLVQLGHAIAGRGRCLLILDNFEQISRHAEATLGRWLERAAQANFLVTTREVLGIPGEEALALAPLPVAEGEALFLRRTAATRRDFQPGPNDLSAIATLVRLLDGLPLAIELAAARTRTLDPQALLARMSERFKLLASSGGRLDRQATLRATFDWSWDLLSPAEKMALAQLSVFEGGFSLEAAEGVIDLDALPSAPWPLDVIHSLVDKSFVRPQGQGRFDLLVSVQAYADEHLRSDGRYPGSGPAALATAQSRHAAWFARLGPQRATDQGCIELDNLVAACRRAAQQGDAGAATGTLEGAWAALALRGPFQVGAELAEMLSAMPALPDREAARVHAVRGSALAAIGRRGPAADALEQALRHAQQVADRACEAAASSALATLHARQGRFELALAEHAQALALARGAADPGLECTALNGLGGVHFEQSQLELAQQHWDAALVLARWARLRRWEGRVLGNLGNLHANRGDMAEAQRCCEAALQVARELGDRKSEGNSLANLAMLHQLQSRPAEATQAGQAAVHLAQQLGHPQLACVAMCNLGLAQGELGDAATAEAHFEAALQLARDLSDRRAEGQILGYLGQARARRGDTAVALRLLDEGQQLLKSMADPLSLAMLLCCRSEAEALAGYRAAARLARDEAAQLAAAAGAGPASELGQALARLDQLLTQATALSR
jgi:predicted ATPase/class 3 adenylate cyclase